MGLSGAFGDKVYVCKSCGYQSGLFSPNCPKCLAKGMANIAGEKKGPGPSATNTGAPRYETEAPKKRGVSFEIIAIVIGLVVVVYATVFHKPDPNANKPVEEPQTVQPEQHAARPVHRVVHHAAVAPVQHVSVPRAHATPAGSLHRGTMKLWSADDE